MGAARRGTAVKRVRKIRARAATAPRTGGAKQAAPAPSARARCQSRPSRADKPLNLTRMNEDGSETVEDMPRRLRARAIRCWPRWPPRWRRPRRAASARPQPDRPWQEGPITRASFRPSRRLFRGPSRSAGVLLVRLSALLLARAPRSNRLEQDQAGLYHLFAGSRFCGMKASLSGAALLHLVAWARRTSCTTIYSRKSRSTMIP